METDEQLYLHYLDGDEKSLCALIERYGNSLTFYIERFIHDFSDSEDLMMEAFSRLLERKPHFYSNGFRSYLFKTGRHLAMRYIAKHHRHPCFGFEDLEKEPESKQLIEALALAKERNRILHLSMDQLPCDYREVLYLLYFEDMSYAEAAKIMKKNEKQIANLAHRGRKALRPLLEKEGITDAYN